MFSIIFQVFVIALFLSAGGFLIYLTYKKIFSPKKIIILKDLLKNENFKKAINLAKDILIKDKANVAAHYYLGLAYYYIEKFELALIELKFAEKKGYYEDINEKELREKLSEIYIKNNNIDEALKEYIFLIKKYPENHEYYFKVGELFQSKNIYNQAIKYYSNCVKLNKTFVPGIVNIGVLLFENKNYMESQKYLQKAISLEPNNYKSYFYLGLIDINLSKYNNALKNFEKSIFDKDLMIRSLMERGKIFITQNKFDDAVFELDRALKNCEEENNIKMNIRYALANCFELRRNLTEAISLWEEIYSLQPKFRDVAEKLTNYQDLRVDDRMKDFLTATDPDFIDMSKGIIEHMGLNVIETVVLTKDSIELLCLESDAKWRNVKKRPKIIHISRKTSPIDEGTIKRLNDKMRENGIIRGLVITSSTYSKLAVSYAKERPIELIDKNGLQNILKEVNL